MNATITIPVVAVVVLYAIPGLLTTVFSAWVLGRDHKETESFFEIALVTIVLGLVWPVMIWFPVNLWKRLGQEKKP